MAMEGAGRLPAFIPNKIASFQHRSTEALQAENFIKADVDHPILRHAEISEILPPLDSPSVRLAR